MLSCQVAQPTTDFSWFLRVFWDHISLESDWPLGGKQLSCSWFSPASLSSSTSSFSSCGRLRAVAISTHQHHHVLEVMEKQFQRTKSRNSMKYQSFVMPCYRHWNYMNLWIKWLAHCLLTCRCSHVLGFFLLKDCTILLGTLRALIVARKVQALNIM